MRETRWACCMLWVTMTIVTCVCQLDRSSPRSGRVEIGSSAEQGSSISSTSGLTARARAMQSRCCWPPESDVRRARRAGPSPRSRARPGAGSARPARRASRTRFPTARGPRGRSRRSTWPGTGSASGRPCRCGVRDARWALTGGRRCRRRRARPCRPTARRHQLVHPVQDAQERRLAAARGADQRRHLLAASAAIPRAPCGRRTRRCSPAPRPRIVRRPVGPATGRRIAIGGGCGRVVRGRSSQRAHDGEGRHRRAHAAAAIRELRRARTPAHQDRAPVQAWSCQCSWAAGRVVEDLAPGGSPAGRSNGWLM